MDSLTLLLFCGGLGLLIGGAESLVRGASRLAATLGLSPLVIGLTVVAYGTSAPELAVSLQAALSDQADLSLGNVLGSNIFNVLFILGLSALITPLMVSVQLVRLDVPLLIGVSFLLYFMALDGVIGRLDGVLLFCGGVLYTVFALWQSRREQSSLESATAATSAAAPRRFAWLGHITLIGLGLACLVLGSRWLVTGAIALARALGIDELVIGLTIVAAGTSLPEVATSVVASLRGERDIAVGNVIGSNLFNILMVLGSASIFAPQGIGVAASALAFDFPVMLAVALACLPIFFTGQRIARWEGAVFFGYYLAYTLYIVLAASHHHALPIFSTVMLAFVIPLTVLTLLVVTIRALSRRS